MRPLSDLEADVLRRAAPGAPDGDLPESLWHACWELEERGLVAAEVDGWHVQTTSHGLLAVRVHDAYVAGLEVKP